jgi:anti-sigma B factor antagonist
MKDEESSAQHGAMVPRLDVSWTSGPNGVHLAATGEIDSASAQEFLANLQDAIIDTDGPIIVDLGTVTFIDSTGLNALITAQASSDGRLYLGTLNTTVRRVLEVTALLDRFPRSQGRWPDTGVVR